MRARDYQRAGIYAGVQHFVNRSKEPAIMVFPTGSGKSLILAKIVRMVNEPFIIIQTTKEILEQNIAKFRAAGGEATIYSSILREKKLSRVMFVTIGSVINDFLAFRNIKSVIIDECHCVNPKGGMYDFFLNSITGITCLGLTATPFRLTKSGKYSISEILTRQVPSFFKNVIHVTQQQEIRDLGFLCPIEYKTVGEINLNNVKIKGVEYDESSLLNEMQRVNIADLIIQEIEEQETQRKHILVFVEFIKVLESIVIKKPNVAYITGTTDPDERERMLKMFMSGEIKTLINVGVLTTGFDFQQLDTVIVAKATRSLALWYQIVGRGQRIHPQKENCLVVDMCKNLHVLGDPQKIVIKQVNNKWIAFNDKISTNKIY